MTVTVGYQVPAPWCMGRGAPRCAPRGTSPIKIENFPPGQVRASRSTDSPSTEGKTFDQRFISKIF